MIDPATIPCRMSRTKEREVEGELLLFHDKNRPGCSLNDSARAVWDLCDGVRDVDAITRVLGDRFDAPPEAFAPDVGYVLQKLADANMLSLIAVAAAETTIADGAIVVRRCYVDVPPQTVDAPLDHPNLEKAIEILRAAWPEGYEKTRRSIEALHPLRDPSFPDDDSHFLHSSQSHSAEEQPGEIWSTVNCSMMLADNLIHEAAHIELFQKGVYKESADALVLNAPDELFASPVITDRKRPMTAVLHGVYAFAHVAELELRVLPGEEGRRAEMLRRRIARHVLRLDQGMEEIRAHIRLDEAGRIFFEDFASWTGSIRSRAEELSIVDAATDSAADAS